MLSTKGKIKPEVEWAIDISQIKNQYLAFEFNSKEKNIDLKRFNPVIKKLIDDQNATLIHASQSAREEALQQVSSEVNYLSERYDALKTDAAEKIEFIRNRELSIKKITKASDVVVRGFTIITSALIILISIGSTLSFVTNMPPILVFIISIVVAITGILGLSVANLFRKIEVFMIRVFLSLYDKKQRNK
jgi:hypothetical protein